MNTPKHVKLMDLFRAANRVVGRKNLVAKEPKWKEYEERLSELVIVWLDGLNPLLLKQELWEASLARSVAPAPVVVTSEKEW
jgi:hypothetical protein